MRGPLSSCSGFMRLSRRHVQVSREGPHRVLGGVASCLVNKITTGAGRAARAGHRAYTAAGGIQSIHATCSHPQCLKAFFFLRWIFFFFSSASLGISPDETQCVPRERRPPGTGRAGFRQPISRPPSLIAGESDAHLQSGLFPSFLVTVFLKGTPRRIAPWPCLLQTFAVT